MLEADMAACGYCHTDLPTGTVRCPECGRMTKLSKKDKVALLMERDTNADLSAEAEKYLHSWQVAKERSMLAAEHRRAVLFQAETLAINSFIAAMIMLASFLLFVYLYLVLNPSAELWARELPRTSISW